MLVGIGCSLFTHGFFHPKAPALSNTRIVHIDDDPWELGKNLPTDCAIQGDIKAVLLELNAALAASQSPEARRTAEERVREMGREKADSGRGFPGALRDRTGSGPDLDLTPHDGDQESDGAGHGHRR